MVYYMTFYTILIYLPFQLIPWIVIIIYYFYKAAKINLYFKTLQVEYNSLKRIIKGLEKKIFDSKNKIIEEGFPLSSTLDVNGEPIESKIYVFRSDAGELDQKGLRNWILCYISWPYFYFSILLFLLFL